MLHELLGVSIQHLLRRRHPLRQHRHQPAVVVPRVAQHVREPPQACVTRAPAHHHLNHAPRGERGHLRRRHHRPLGLGRRRRALHGTASRRHAAPRLMRSPGGDDVDQRRAFCRPRLRRQPLGPCRLVPRHSEGFLPLGCGCLEVGGDHGDQGGRRWSGAAGRAGVCRGSSGVARAVLRFAALFGANGGAVVHGQGGRGVLESSLVAPELSQLLRGRISVNPAMGQSRSLDLPQMQRAILLASQRDLRALPPTGVVPYTRPAS
mmetsp:Transcript_48522/g.105692  ORF Transcript_48522/g.105692 Transcript_48522/m.105692 type:complete len:263 (-) Transcript_48522:45-833(-)